jgi:PAS domain S-box-containing protein
VTPGHLIQRFNKGAEQALGYSRDEVQGKRVEILFDNPEDRKRALSQLDHTDNIRNFPTNFRTKHGEIRNVLLTLSRLRDREGNPIGTFGISKDITEEQKLLRKLFRSKRDAAIGQAVTGIQHAIKNMLNALKGGAYLVKIGIRDDNRDRLQEGWGMVEEGIERMTAISMNLLNYAKDWKPEYELTDLTDMLAKVNEMVKLSASDRGISVRAELDDGLPRVMCDPILVHMAIMDIVSNAIDACAWKDYSEGQNPEVVMRNELDDGGRIYTIGIGDNGCGMSEEMVKNIFTPFFSTKNKLGTGLGLAMTSRVVEVHGGTIKVESEPDKGTTFWIRLSINGSENGKESSDD